MGAGLSLTQVQMVLEARVEALPQEKTELYRALLHQLRALAGQQIRNVAVSPPLWTTGSETASELM